MLILSIKTEDQECWKNLTGKFKCLISKWYNKKISIGIKQCLVIEVTSNKEKDMNKF